MSNDQYSNQPPVDPNQQPYQPYNQAPPNQQQQPYQPYNQPPPDQQQPYQPYQPYTQGPTTQPQGQFVVPSSDQLVSGFKGLSQGRRLAIGGGLVAWISYFLPWYTQTAELSGISGSISGLYEFPWLGFILLTALLVTLITPLFGKNIYSMVKPLLNNISQGMATFYAAATVLGISLIGAFIAKPNDLESLGLDSSFSFGFYLAILALGAATAGGWMMQQNRE
ncbi:hypothetical protein ACP8Y2_22200 [Herpetosiphon llansteffanensis]